MGNRVSIVSIFWIFKKPFPLMLLRFTIRQVHRILLSIFDMAHRTRCQTTGKWQLNLAKPLHNMEHLIIQNCNRKSLVRRPS